MQELSHIPLEHQQPDLFPCVILAGGLSTRLGALTSEKPKSMLVVSGRPFIDWQLSWLSGAGIREVTMCIGHLGEQIVDFVEDGSRWGITVQFVHDGEQLLGTGGAARTACSKVKGDAFFLLYGDSYLSIDFQSVQQSFLAQKRSFLMTVYQNQDLYDRSNIVFRDGQISKYSKESKDWSPAMKWIDYGLSLIRRETFMERVQANMPVDLGEILKQLTTEGLVMGYEVFDRFYEIGSAQGIDEFERDHPNLHNA